MTAPVDPEVQYLLDSVLEALDRPVGLPFAWQHRIHSVQVILEGFLDGGDAGQLADQLRDMVAPVKPAPAQPA